MSPRKKTAPAPAVEPAVTPAVTPAAAPAPAPIHAPTHADIVAQARRHALICIQALAEEVAAGSGAARISAAKELLDRGCGKAGRLEEGGDQRPPSGPEGASDAQEGTVSPDVAAALRALE